MELDVLAAMLAQMLTEFSLHEAIEVELFKMMFEFAAGKVKE